MSVNDPDFYSQGDIRFLSPKSVFDEDERGGQVAMSGKMLAGLLLAINDAQKEAAAMSDRNVARCVENSRARILLGKALAILRDHQAATPHEAVAEWIKSAQDYLDPYCPF